MIKEFVFTIGLPGCGKTTYIANNYKDYWTCPFFNETKLKNIEDSLSSAYYLSKPYNSGPIIVSADYIKTRIPGYQPDKAYLVHEQSVQVAKNTVFAFADASKSYDCVLMDGGAINNHYTSDIINYIRIKNPDCKIKALFFDTPVEVCIKRIEGRERKVPIEAIYEKNQKLISCVNRYRDMVDEFVRVDYYTNKYLLLDMDGTIAGYSKVKFDEEGNADFTNGEFFKHLRPVNWIIDFVKKHYDMKNVYIVTAVANNICWQEKCEWLDKYFPEIPKENRLWCGNKEYKYVYVKQLAVRNGWERNEMVLIDDYHPTIEKCKKHNINCLHPSNIEALIDPYAIFS